MKNLFKKNNIEKSKEQIKERYENVANKRNFIIFISLILFLTITWIFIYNYRHDIYQDKNIANNNQSYNKIDNFESYFYEAQKKHREMRNSFFRDPFFTTPFTFPSIKIDNYMNIDILEAWENLIVKADLHWYKKEDIKVDLDQAKFLTISATKSSEKEEQNQDKYYLKERWNSSISRVINLPYLVNKSTIEANFKEWVLVIEAKKLEDNEEEAIKIN